jgi:cytochrome c553
MSKKYLSAAIVLLASILTNPQLLAADAPIVGDAAAGKQKITVCATCHAEDGNSVISTNPSLAGQHPSYLIQAMTEYQQGANGPRNNAIMAGMVAGLSAQDIADIAAYYSSQTPKIGAADPTLVKQGEALYRGGDVERGIPACIACHGPTGEGNGLAKFPAVAGQNPDYIIAALKEYQSGARQNVMMQDVAGKLTDADMRTVATYIYGLYPTGTKLPEEAPAATPAAASATNTNAATATPAAAATDTTNTAVPATAAPAAATTQTQ